MIRKIPASELRPGMFIHSLGRDWMDHPFLRERFAIRSADVVRKIIRHGIHEVYIDTRKGADLPNREKKETTEPEPPVAVPVTMSAMFEGTQEPTGASLFPPFPTAPTLPPALLPDIWLPPEPPTPLADERRRATRTWKEGLQTLSTVLSQARFGSVVELPRVQAVAGSLAGSLARNRNALLCLGYLRHKDRYTFEHSLYVGVLMMAFAASLELPVEVVQEIGVGAMLHDIGKARVPDSILNKEGRLSEDEQQQMRRHVEFSRQMLQETPGIGEVALACAAEHHERIDGSGYPHGLRGDEISLHGRMSAICDVYDALTSDRCYHKGCPPKQALAYLLENAGSHFDTELVHHFIRFIGIYPIGTMVRLANGHLGVVTGTAPDLLQPPVRAFFDTRTQAYLTPYEADGEKERVIGAESPQRWGVNPHLFLV